jgi:hypothetical protein
VRAGFEKTIKKAGAHIIDVRLCSLISFDFKKIVGLLPLQKAGIEGFTFRASSGLPCSLLNNEAFNMGKDMQ